MLSDALKDMLEELSTHHRDKKDLRKMYVIDRLNTSVKNYYTDLLTGYNELVKKDALKVMREMNKEN